jgi:hypothetical protein
MSVVTVPNLPLTHNFEEDLEQSHKDHHLPQWESCYRYFFPTMQSMSLHLGNEWNQNAGVDRCIRLTDGKSISIDEKVGHQAFKTIPLEFWSDCERKRPGWVRKQMLCDYIAYLILPLGKCHLLPVIQLQAAWKIHGEEWKSRFKTKSSSSGRWTTEFCPVPPDVLYPAMGAMLRYTF